jgi:RimJ/RimL family protein N-acetyltransferase
MRTLTPSPIRVATIADVDRLVTMALEFLAQPPFVAMGPASPRHVRAFVERLITSTDSVVFVATDHGQIVGMIGAGLFEHQLTGQLTGQEVGWWMTPDARGARVALRLLEEAEFWAFAAGAVAFQVQGPNEKVGRFYQRKGYQQYEAGYFRRLSA